MSKFEYQIIATGEVDAPTKEAASLFAQNILTINLVALNSNPKVTVAVREKTIIEKAAGNVFDLIKGKKS